MSLENQTEKLVEVVLTLNKVFMFSNIPFIILTGIIFAFQFHSLKSLIRSSANIDNESFEHKKARGIKILVLKFINAILFIELLRNISGLLTGLIYGYDSFYTQIVITHMNSCEINIEIDFELQLFPKGWIIHLPVVFYATINLLLQPIVSLLLAVLRRAYLDRPYRTIIKRWSWILSIRTCILFALMSYYRTVYIITSLVPIFYIVDFIIYIRQSSKFHGFLKNRMEVARVQSDDRREFRDKSTVFLQYRITSFCTTLTFSILTLAYIVYGIKSLYGSVRILCFLNFITFGYTPLIFFNNSSILILLNKISLYLFIIYHGMDLFYQLLISIAYLLVCIAIGIRIRRRLKNFKQINRIIHQLVENYHKTVR